MQDVEQLIERLEARAKCHFAGTCDIYYEEDAELDQEAAAMLRSLSDSANNLKKYVGEYASEIEALRAKLERRAMDQEPKAMTDLTEAEFENGIKEAWSDWPTEFKQAVIAAARKGIEADAMMFRAKLERAREGLKRITRLDPGREDVGIFAVKQARATLEEIKDES